MFNEITHSQYIVSPKYFGSDHAHTVSEEQPTANNVYPFSSSIRIPLVTKISPGLFYWDHSDIISPQKFHKDNSQTLYPLNTVASLKLFKAKKSPMIYTVFR
jgi:hypothetical protein